MAAITFSNVTKRFTPGDAPAVDDVSLEIDSGEFFVLVGPSGCGKTTLLRIVAGLERPTSGSVHIDDRNVTHLLPRDRDIAMVFQNYAIYPHMTVRQNMGYGLKVRGVPKSERRRRIDEVGRLLGLEELLERRPSTLSGGQLQRVAIGRAIAREPSAYLMDEPLSNLDAKLRVSMRAELGALHRRLGVTTVYVTHDQVEAMTLGDRTAVLRQGVVEQVDTPQRLYDRPASAFVARFIGSPPTNFAVGSCNGSRLSFGGIEMQLPEQLPPPCREGERVLVGVRPDDLREPRFAERGATKFEVKVMVREDLGPESLLFYSVPSQEQDRDEIRRAAFEDTPTSDGVDAGGEIDPFALHCARVSARYPGQPGDVVLLTVAPEALHFFDIEDGMRLPMPAID